MALKGKIVPEPVDIGQIAVPPFAQLPDAATLFESRAERLAALAPGHALEPYLRFLTAIARAQHGAVGQLPAGTLPGKDHIAFCHARELPVLDRLAWKRDASFVAGARAIATELTGTAMPEPAAQALAAFAGRDDASLEALADRVLREEHQDGEVAEVLFAGAALELHFACMAALLDPADLAPVEPRSLCPVCGSLAIASVVEAAHGRQGARFLCCSLCQTRWNYTRIQCAHCVSTKGIAYQNIEGGSKAVRAETCNECRTYTKILYLEEDADIDPVADDLASLPLDILVSEAGWARACPSFYLMPDGDDGDLPPLSSAG
ncbi:formate dehydrogenase accessory protein FdhE [Vineibacter terrae]|uniref:Formate dehydrogenase accessory protein FdhE n=1 Tax=Vineibacter terrae TaxID=2586908 RepID=A0A5C8PT01_9HYPH|nr:formate dehydrogenase accessory protein FdhE [Vineibacter terrae]TXL79447.1 formate dehydrogenase accessory protein FdhE [Vineibacter terrae]